MATIEANIRTLLIADGTISGLIGSRFYSVENPQDPTYPLINLERLSGVRQYSMDGQTGPTPGRFEINCYSDTLNGARVLGEAVRSKLSGFAGTAGSGTIHGAFLQDSEDIYDKELKKHIVSMDWEVWYNET